MNRPDVEKYEKLAGAATAGPWEVTGEGDWDREVGSALEYVCRGPGDYAGDSCFEEADAALIAASRTAIPELCAYVHELEALLRDWRACCSQACGGSDECVRRAEEAGK